MKTIVSFLILLCITTICLAREYEEIATMTGNSCIVSFSRDLFFAHVIMDSIGSSCGDGWSEVEMMLLATNGYISFPLLFPKPGYHLRQVTANFSITQVCGNDTAGVYPIFDNSAGMQISPDVMIEHIYFGSRIDYQDLITPPLHPAEILLDAYTPNWIAHDVTNWVIDDINTNRSYTQYRLKFRNNSDWDYWRDYISFCSTSENAVYLRYVFESDSMAVVDYNSMPITNVSLHPNPFHLETTITYSLQKTSQVAVTIYNLKGQKIKSLFRGMQARGDIQISWDGKSENGNHCASGVYLLRIEINGQIQTKRLMLLK